jgi:hypothetical protein
VYYISGRLLGIEKREGLYTHICKIMKKYVDVLVEVYYVKNIRK